MWPFLLAYGRRRRTLLLLGHALLLTGAVLLLAGHLPERPALLRPGTGTEVWLTLVLAGAALGLLSRRNGTLSRPEILALVLSGLLLVGGLTLPGLRHLPATPRWTLLMLLAAVACAWQGAAAKVLFPPLRLVLVGRDPLLTDLARLVAQDPGAFDIQARVSEPSRLETLPPAAADLVIYGMDLASAPEALVRLRLQGVRVWDAATFFQTLTGRVPLGSIDATWLLMQAGRRRPDSRLSLAVKRLLDLVLALLLLPVALPVLAVCALAIKLDSRGPVFFVQERLGQGGVPFRLYKLRTMVVEAEAAGPQWCRDHDPRITRVGRVLRRLRLDELPQIFNVLKNEMSFVGPRPIRAYFTDRLAREIPFYRLRLLAKPGLSGWAQVHSGHANTVAAHALMLQYDLYYLLHRSLFLDLLVILKTLLVLLRGQGR